MEKLTLNAEFLFEFKTFNQWVTYAESWYQPYGQRIPTVAINSEGNVCHIGEDFMLSRDKGLFPVKVYRLQRVADLNN